MARTDFPESSRAGIGPAVGGGVGVGSSAAVGVAVGVGVGTIGIWIFPIREYLHSVNQMFPSCVEVIANGMLVG